MKKLYIVLCLISLPLSGNSAPSEYALLYTKTDSAACLAYELLEGNQTPVADSLRLWLNRVEGVVCQYLCSGFTCQRDRIAVIQLVSNRDMNILCGIASDTVYRRNGSFIGWKGDTLQILLSIQHVLYSPTIEVALTILHELYHAFQARQVTVLYGTYQVELAAWQFQAKMFARKYSKQFKSQRLPNYFARRRSDWATRWVQSGVTDEEKFTRGMVLFCKMPMDAMRHVYRNGGMPAWDSTAELLERQQKRASKKAHRQQRQARFARARQLRGDRMPLAW